MNDLSAIILAAGKGGRIGCPKWQLSYGNGTFLSTIIDKLHQIKISNIVCVASNDSIPNDLRAILAINPTPEQEMISSIYYGVQAANHSGAYLIIPVDHPHFKTATLNKLYEGYQAHNNKVIRPRFQNKMGHPIIIPQKLAKLLTENGYTGGLKQFMESHQVKYYDVMVDDAGILKNVNTKADL